MFPYRFPRPGEVRLATPLLPILLRMALGAVMLLAGCQGEQSLPLETIARGAGSRYESGEPTLDSEPAATDSLSVASPQTDLLSPGSPSPAYPGLAPLIGLAYPLPQTTIERPTPLPTPTPSAAALAVIAYIAQHKGIPPGALRIEADDPTEYPNLEGHFQAVTLLDSRPKGGTYKLLVDLQSGEIVEDIPALLAAAGQAWQARYGKLHPWLYDILQTKGPDDEIQVFVWFACTDFGPIWTRLRKRHPGLDFANVKPGDPSAVGGNEVLAREIRIEYGKLLSQAYLEQERLLAELLRTRGRDVTTYGILPSIAASLPKREILEIATGEDVSAIYHRRGWNPIQVYCEAMPSDCVPPVWNDFPLLLVVAPRSRANPPALYRVEGNEARQVPFFKDMDVDDMISCRLSPDGQRGACLLYGNDSTTTIAVVDLRDFQLAPISSVNWGERGSAHDELTSIAWMDNEHIAYTRMRWPSMEEELPPSSPLPIHTEVWLSSADGKEQRLLATGRTNRVLGISPDGQRLYVTYLLPGMEIDKMEGFATLDIASGALRYIWPGEEQTSGSSYFAFRLVTLPDGTQRVTFVALRQGPNTTVPTQPPVIWQLDPESLEAKAIWTVHRGTSYEKGGQTGMVYDLPEGIIWSSESAHRFIYYAGGAVWRVDLESQKDERLGEASRNLLAWTAEGIVSQDEATLCLLDEASGTERMLCLGAGPGQR